MVGESDSKDRNESRAIAIALIILVAVLVIVAIFFLPVFADSVATYFSPGVGLKTAAMIAFVVSVVLMVIFAIASGDGLIGEIQFVLGGFFMFFLIIWILIAWVF